MAGDVEHGELRLFASLRMIARTFGRLVFTARQAERFWLPAGVLDETLRWLELPQHHFLCADGEIPLTACY